MWRQRCFELLASGELVYSHQGRELGRVALKGVTVTTPSSCCHSEREFAVRAAGQVLTLRAANADERDTWVRKLLPYTYPVRSLKDFRLSFVVFLFLSALLLL